MIKMGDDAAAAPLLREAVQGLTDVYDAEHPMVRHLQDFLDDLGEGSGSEEESEPEAEEETMYQRMAKRRRRE